MTKEGPFIQTGCFFGTRDEFTEESRRAFDGVFTEIAQRPVPDVLVIGHTDRVGTDAANDELSRQRAEAVMAVLRAAGVPAAKLSAKTPVKDISKQVLVKGIKQWAAFDGKSGGKTIRTVFKIT